MRGLYNIQYTRQLFGTEIVCTQGSTVRETAWDVFFTFPNKIIGTEYLKKVLTLLFLHIFLSKE